MIGKEIRKQRTELELSLHALGALTCIDPGVICRVELGTYEPSPQLQRDLMSMLAAVRSLREEYENVPLDMRAVTWLRVQLEKRNGARPRRKPRKRQGDFGVAAAQAR